MEQEVQVPKKCTCIRAKRLKFLVSPNRVHARKTCAKSPPWLLRGKSGAEQTSTNTFDSGNSEEKINKRFTGESWKQFEFEPCYTCEKTSQLSYESRVLHSIMVVHAYEVYSRGAPAILTILLIYIHLSTKNM